MLTGYDHLTGRIEGLFSADYVHWEECCRENIKEVLKIIIDVYHMDTLTCMFCAKNSLHYTKAASLGKHYKYQHEPQIIKFYLDNIVKISPVELQCIVSHSMRTTPINN